MSECGANSNSGVGKMTWTQLCTVTWEFTFHRPVSSSRSGRHHHVWVSQGSAVWVLSRSINRSVPNLCYLPMPGSLTHSFGLFDKSHGLFPAFCLSPLSIPAALGPFSLSMLRSYSLPHSSFFSRWSLTGQGPWDQLQSQTASVQSCATG